MSFYVLAGQYANHLGRLLSAPTPTPAEDGSFPVAGLYDRRSNFPFKFGSIAADSVVVADLCIVPDASFEVGISNWTAATGTMTQSNTTANSGTYSAKFAAAGSYYFDFTAVAGEARQISAALYGGGAGVPSIVRLYCVETGHYLQSGGASWAVSSSDIMSRETVSWATSTQAYTVEPLSTTLTDTVTLRIYVVQTGAGTTYRDDVVDIPGTTWASVHGHNIGPVVTVTIDSSPDNSSWTTRITPTLRRDSFYGVCTVQYVRYWRLKLGGTPGAIPYMGEWVLGQYQTLSPNPLYPGTLEHDEAQERETTPQGAQHVYLYGARPQRRLTMFFAFRNDTDHQAWEAIYERSRGGGYPLIVAPVEMDSRLVIMGRLEESIAFTKIDYWSRTAECTVVEEPLPLME